MVLKEFSVGQDQYIILITASLNAHVTHLCFKLHSHLHSFYKIKQLMFVRKKYFGGLVQPVLGYGCVTWGSGSRDLLINIKVLTTVS